MALVPTSPGPHVALVPTSPGLHVTLVLTSPGPCAIIACQVEAEVRKLTKELERAFALGKKREAVCQTGGSNA